MRRETKRSRSTCAPAALALLALALPAAAQEAAPDPAELGRRLAEQERQLEQLRQELEALRGARGPAPAGEGSRSDPGQPAEPSELSEPPEGGSAPAGAGSWTDSIRAGKFFLETADEAFRLEFHGRVHVDLRSVLDRGRDDFDNSFQVRRARLDAQGHLFGKERVSFRLGLEFGRTSDADLRDGFVNLRLVDAVQLRLGQMIPPFSTERHTSSNYMLHPERPIVVGDTIGQRDIGVMLHGQLLDERLTYFIGAYGGEGENERVDTDDDFDLATRLEVAPVEWLLLAASYIYSPTNRDSRPSDVHTVGDEFTTFLDYDAGTRRLGNRQRVGVDARLRFSALELKGELILDYQQDVTGANGEEVDIEAWGWFVDGAWVFLGAREGPKIVPAAPLHDPETGAWGPGAFDLALRYEEYRVEADVIREGLATGTDRVRAATATLHWYPYTSLRFSASYTLSMFDDRLLLGDERRNDESAAILRATLYF